MGNHDEHISDALGVENKMERPVKTTLPTIDEQENLHQMMLFDQEKENNNLPEKSQNREEIPEVVIVPKDQAVKDARQDYAEVRGRLHQLSETGQQALEGILNVAEESEHPRAYEVVAQLIKTLSENAKELMKLHHDTQDLEDKKNALRNKSSSKEPDQQPQETTTNNNAIFVGSTADLQRFFEEQKKTKVIDD